MLNAMTDEEYMQLALQEARAADVIGEIPIGAVLVVEGEVVAKAHNMRETWNDATAHAEVIVIREACKKLGRWRLEEGPCFMLQSSPVQCVRALSSTVVSTRLFTAVLMLKPEGQSRSLISSVIPILIIRHRSSAASVKPNVHR